MITGFWVADLALILWIPFAAFVMTAVRPALGASLVMVGGMLLLPPSHGFDFAGLPPIEKESISSVAVLIGSLLVAHRRFAAARLGRGLEILLIPMLLGAIGTLMTNRDPIARGFSVLPGLQSYDVVSLFIRDLLQMGVPFVIGRVLFRTRRDLLTLLGVFVSGAVVYSAAVFLEVRMSPQLCNIVYGYHPHSFGQTVRFGGFRPVVFMAHGLAVALFMLAASLGAIVLYRVRVRVLGQSSDGVAAWLVVALIFCKSLGSLVYAAVLLPLTLLATARTQLRVASLIAFLVMTYPLLRMLDLVPVEEMASVAAAISEERAESLDVRFANETMLLAKARERIVFGWGGFGRNRVFDEAEGRDLSIADGYWIIILGSRGLVGFFVAFGLLLLPIGVARRVLPRVRDRRDRLLLAGFSVVVATYSLDLIPNGLFANLPYLLAGSLSGYAGAVAESARPMRRRARADAEAGVARRSYARGEGVITPDSRPVSK